MERIVVPLWNLICFIYATFAKIVVGILHGFAVMVWKGSFKMGQETTRYWLKKQDPHWYDSRNMDAGFSLVLIFVCAVVFLIVASPILYK